MRFLYFIPLFLAAIAPGALAQRAVINEVMYAPIKPEPEWIELFNPSDSNISTSDWNISDLLKTYSLPQTVIPGQGYLLLTKDSAALANKYPQLSLNILQMTFPSLNNTGDLILLKDSLGIVIDNFHYFPGWGGADGRSLERIDFEAPSDSSNFGTSVATGSATPGGLNSIHRRDFDLAIESLSYKSRNENDLAITVTIVNKGRKQISGGEITLSSNSGLPIAISQTSSIEPLQKQNTELIWQNADHGKSHVTCFVTASGDEMHSNDTLRAQVYTPIPRNAVVINEIMALPLSSSCQWIELYNNSLNIAHLDSTSFLVSGVDTMYTFRIDSLTLLPKHYGVISAGNKLFSAFPSLQNRNEVILMNKGDLKLTDLGNEIMLINTDNSIIDSLNYSSTWHSPNVTNHTGISLERKLSNVSGTDPSNWSSSLDTRGSTPLERNSYSEDSLVTATSVDVQILPNPFSPDGDGFDDAANITIAIPGDNEEVISAKLYDLRGRLRSSILQNKRIFRYESLRFEGKDDNGITLEIGLYTLVVESQSNAFKPQRKGVVIMKKAK